LSSFGYFLSHEAEDPQSLVFGEMYGFNGFASCRQLIDDRNVEVAIQGHGQSPWYRCSGHDQHVRRNAVFAPELGTLFYAEAMLFVDDDEAYIFEFDLIFNEGVCSY